MDWLIQLAIWRGTVARVEHMGMSTRFIRVVAWSRHGLAFIELLNNLETILGSALG